MYTQIFIEIYIHVYIYKLNVYLFINTSIYIYIKGIVGLTYWYQVKADCSFWGIKPTKFDNDNIITVAQSAFQFALTDNLNDDNKRALIIVSIEPYMEESIQEKNLILRSSIFQVTSHMQHSERRKEYNNNDINVDGTREINDEIITELIHIQIDTWIPSLALAEDIVMAFDR
jgi:hypothetical protein